MTTYGLATGKIFLLQEKKCPGDSRGWMSSGFWVAEDPATAGASNTYFITCAHTMMNIEDKIKRDSWIKLLCDPDKRLVWISENQVPGPEHGTY